MADSRSVFFDDFACLSRTNLFNHVTMKYERGFRILTLLWSDEYSSINVIKPEGKERDTKGEYSERHERKA